ncbi:MAG: phosphate ABC transporter permease PstA [Actinomycetota bacterium]|nr:phosphate ABC transporter permease PstA [Actinomycetota bacterium]
MSAHTISLGRRARGERARGRAFYSLLLFSITIGFVLLATLLVDVFQKGIPFVDGILLTNPPSANPDKAGARPAILGTVYLMGLLLVMSVPIGVGTAVYLEEYANRERWYNRLLEINIQNLAAVPSIVYGILGLAFLVRGLGLGRVLLAGAMILTLLVLPIVIVSSREAIRAVPDSIRQGAFALGATPWQVVWRQVLPSAVPGIATGSILALARAIGETAPLLLVGALTYVAVDPTLFGSFTALPIQVYQWIARPQEDFKLLAAAGIIVLLVLLLTMNAFAIWLRNRYQRRW